MVYVRNLEDGLAAALAAGALGAGASVPVSLSANQGVLQTVINAILAGGGSALGSAVGYRVPGASPMNIGLNTVGGGLIGMAGGQTLGNLVGTDRNEYAIGGMANLYSNTAVDEQQAILEREAYEQLAKKAISGLSESKREKLKEEVAPMREIVAARRAELEATRPEEPLPLEEAERTKAIVMSILGNPNAIVY